jgi:hypothetical protein
VLSAQRRVNLPQKAFQNQAPPDKPPVFVFDAIHNGIRVPLHFLRQSRTHKVILSQNNLL